MEGVKRFLETSPLAARVKLPTRIIVHRGGNSPEALAGVIRAGTYAPAGGDTCELEAGGIILARGKIVKRRGEFYFKVIEKGEGKT